MNTLHTPSGYQNMPAKSWPQSLPSLIFCVLLLPSSLFGQTSDIVGEDVYQLEAFTVLGSAITRFDRDVGQPVTMMVMEDLETDGFVSPGEMFTEMVFTGSPEFSESSDGPNDARGDVTSVNLRGAGPGQSLILLNGRRLAVHPLNMTVGQTPSVLVNANVIPSGLIDRIDVLRDGASAIYGTDASAGVVNTLLSKKLLGETLRIRYGQEGDGDFTEQMYSYSGGWDFNGGDTNISVYAGYFARDPIIATSRSYAMAGDKRPLVDEQWRGDVSIINVSSGGVYANLESDLSAKKDALYQDGVRITDSTGRFHINAPGLEGTTAILADGTAIDGGTLPREERYDYAPDRTLTSEVKRQNLFFTLNHAVTDDIELFAELGYYHSETWQKRASVVIGTSDAIVIPSYNYYNPFGPVTFADGRTNPNRISGITLENGDPLPEEGIAIQLDGWRAQDIGPRLVDVEADSYLFTVGLSGKVFDKWYWESAVRYNLNEATDTTGNRLSKTVLTQVLADDTAKALNVFAGPGMNNPADFQDLIIEVSRTAETELLSYDLRANTPNLFTFLGKEIGLAVGVEARKETYADDRDPLIDGTIRYDDTYQGASDVVGVSPTNDTESDRTVVGVYSEMLIPLIDEDNRAPLFHRVELQLAARWEDYNDFGDITKPKAALFWHLTPNMMVRGSYAEGFTAPNLSILTEPIQRFNTGIADSYRELWDADNPENDGSDQMADLRGGNNGLGPEESKTKTVGLVWNVSAIKGLTMTVDYWNIAISNRIGTVGPADIIDADAAILESYSSNASDYTAGEIVTGDLRVERGPITDELIALAVNQGFAPAGPIIRLINPFVNEAGRDIAGWDFILQYQTPKFSFGSFRLRAELSYLDTFEDQEIEGGAVTNLVQDEINPRVRANLNLSWRNGPWSAGISTRYISKTYDNDVLDTEGNMWVIEDYWNSSIRGGYRFKDGLLKGMTVSGGIRNLFDVDPPLNPDESFGYEISLHSNRRRHYYVDLKYSF